MSKKMSPVIARVLLFMGGMIAGFILGAISGGS